MRHAPFILAEMLVLALAAVAHPAAAVGAGAISLDVPAVVTAGQTVVLRWSTLPEEIEEMEIVLSLDGGGSYHVRVSPELVRAPAVRAAAAMAPRGSSAGFAPREVPLRL